MDYLQGDLFGNFTKPLQPVKPSHKFKTMQELHGVIEGHICKECKHCLKLKYHDYSYHKCELWKMSNSAATDIRLKNKACGKFEKEE